MTAPLEIQDLVADVVHAYPGAQLEFSPLPSGVCFLWVTVDGRSFVMEHDPRRGTGVSENQEDTLPFTGHDHAFESLKEAIRHFKRLLAGASKPAAAAIH